MTDHPPGPDSGPDNRSAASPSAAVLTGTPRWVKVFVIVAVALVVLFLIATITGVGGEHGPRRHSGGDPSPSVVVKERVHPPPVDHRK